MMGKKILLYILIVVLVFLATFELLLLGFEYFNNRSVNFPPISRSDFLKQHLQLNKQRLKIYAQQEEALFEPIAVEFFYSGGCSPCQQLKDDFIAKIESQYKGRIVITAHDTRDHNEYLLKLALEDAFGIAQGDSSEVFLPTQALIGTNEIKQRLAGAIEEILEQQKPFISLKKIFPQGNPLLRRFFAFTPILIILAGLADGINPCAFATIVFFVSFLAINNYRKKQITFIGSAFIVGVFLTYLALGLGIFQALKKLQLFSLWSRLVYVAVAFLALGMGIYHLVELIIYKKTGQTKGCSLLLYNRLRTIAESKKALIILIISALITGFIIALLESACTGQVYFPIITFVSKIPSLRMHALMYLVLYNLAFILPLVVIFILAYHGATSEKIALFTERHYAAIKIIYILLFFGLSWGLLFIF